MKALIGLLLLLVCTGAVAQLHHDPLTSVEIDQMRDTAQEPEKRIDLVLSFARARLLGVEKLHVNAKSGGPDLTKSEELLGDFALLIDELDDNLDAYDRRGEDLRIALRRVLDTESVFQQQLKGLAEQIGQVRTQGPAAVGLAAALADATDSLQSSTESAGSMLASQERKRGEEQSEKKSGQ